MLAFVTPLAAAPSTGAIPAERQLRIDEAARALADCTVRAAKENKARLTPATIDRIVIGECVEAHGDVVELTWGLPTPVASRVLLMATVDALEAARRAVAD